MPAAESIPSIARLTNAYQGALVSKRRHGDTHAGAIHDHWAGAGALLWQRQAERDREEFASLYFLHAKRNRLDEYIERRWPGKARVVDEPGTGTVRLRRPNAAAGAGVFLEGTRIAVGGGLGGGVSYYIIAADTPCGAATTTPLPVPIVATEAGPASQIHVVSGERAALRVEDPLWDNTWIVDELTCSAGTTRESDEQTRARISLEVIEERFGYESAIIKAMKLVGAETVVLFRSDYLGEALDAGLNRVYVGDANFSTSPELLEACRFALPSCAMAGASVQALAMTTAWLNLTATVRFWDVPDKFDTATALASAKAAVLEYFDTRANPFVWDVAGVRGAIQRAVEDTQDIAITSSSPAPTLLQLFDSYPLPRYRTSLDRITVTLAEPLLA